MARHVLGIAAVVGCTGGLLAAFSCGGTTGREDLPPMTQMDATAADTSPITYVDRMLPDLGVAPPVPEGGEGGYPWPSCPPFLPYPPDQDGALPPLGMEIDQVPADYGDGGASVPAADGSACASYGWLGTTTADECVTSQSAGSPGGMDYIFFPPCNWCGDAGVAVSGPGVGVSRYANCIALYECLVRTGCGTTGSATCLCGDGSITMCTPSGPCANEELSALERSANNIQDALKNYGDLDPTSLGYCGAALNQLYQNARTDSCFADAGH